MSHDIRTPMNAILGYTDLAIKHHDNRTRVDDNLEKIKTAGGHLLNLINDILEMSRIESGKLEITDEPTDLRKLIEGVDQMSNSPAIPKSIDFQTETLEEVGLIADTAEDGEFAVKAVAEKGTDYYDFILMDIQMPLMNGYEATVSIRSMYPDADLPIIALSANAFEEDKMKSFESGMNAHIAKPIDIKELQNVLTKYIGK